MKDKKKRSKEQYINLNVSISRTELEDYMDRKLSNAEFKDAKNSLGDYIEWDDIDQVIQYAIRLYFDDLKADALARD